MRAVQSLTEQVHQLLNMMIVALNWPIFKHMNVDFLRFDRPAKRQDVKQHVSVIFPLRSCVCVLGFISFFIWGDHILVSGSINHV